MARIRVYLATSLDGFIAGPDDDLSWLPGPEDGGPVDGEGLGFEDFMAQIGAMVMGRRTYEVVAGFGGPWPYRETPVLVATRRPLETSQPTVRAVQGEIGAVLDQARARAGDKDVYLDGANLVQQAVERDLVDELVLTTVPVVLGGGVRLFGPLGTMRRYRRVSVVPFGRQLVQLRLAREGEDAPAQDRP